MPRDTERVMRPGALAGLLPQKHATEAMHGLCDCVRSSLLRVCREDSPEEAEGWRTGKAMRRRPPLENGRSMLLKQHTVSGTWQDTTGAKE